MRFVDLSNREEFRREAVCVQDAGWHWKRIAQTRAIDDACHHIGDLVARMQQRFV
jgi:hypothetical protein